MDPIAPSDLAATIAFTGSRALFLDRLNQKVIFSEVQRLYLEAQQRSNELHVYIPPLAAPAGVKELNTAPKIDEAIRELLQKQARSSPSNLETPQQNSAFTFHLATNLPFPQNSLQFPSEFQNGDCADEQERSAATTKPSTNPFANLRPPHLIRAEIENTGMPSVKAFSNYICLDIIARELTADKFLLLAQLCSHINKILNLKDPTSRANWQRKLIAFAPKQRRKTPRANHGMKRKCGIDGYKDAVSQCAKRVMGCGSVHAGI